MIGRKARKSLPWLAVPIIWVLLVGGVGFLSGFDGRLEQVPTITGVFPGPGHGGKPDTLQIPAIDLDAHIIAITLDSDGVLTPPADTAVVGWWDGSSGAGGTRGQMLLTGHTVHTGGGVMNRMGEVKPGDTVTVRSDGKKYEYRVTANKVFSRKKLAENALDLFGQNRHHGRLVLVTCTDFDGHAYLSNIVVFAEPADRF